MMIYALCLALLAAPYPESTRQRLEESVEKYEMHRRVRQAAIDAGLKVVDSTDSLIDIQATSAFPPAQDAVGYWENKEFNLCAFLSGLRSRVDKLPFFKKRRLLR